MAWTDERKPCGWSVNPSCCPHWEDASSELREYASNLAISVLWIKSGRQFGRCERTIRPCRMDCADSFTSSGSWVGNRWVPGHGTGWEPILWGGRWFNFRCGCRRDQCSCGRVCEVELPGLMPEPTQVMVDGRVLSPSTYRVDNGRWLVRTNGGCWPDCQDVAALPTEMGTWQVRFAHGKPVPDEASFLAGILACEIVKSCSPSVNESECRLPSSVSRITRQNTTIQFENMSSLVANINTVGIPEIDMWLVSNNPGGRTRKLTIMSPDYNPFREQSWP